MYIGSLSLTLALMIQYVAIFVKLVTHMSRNLELAQYYDLKKGSLFFRGGCAACALYFAVDGLSHWLASRIHFDSASSVPPTMDTYYLNRDRLTK